MQTFEFAEIQADSSVRRNAWTQRGEQLMGFALPDSDWSTLASRLAGTAQSDTPYAELYKGFR
jgi:hypothetical protein